MVDDEEGVCLRHVACDDAHFFEVRDQRVEAPHVGVLERCDWWWVDEDTYGVLCIWAVVMGGGGGAATWAARASSGCVLRWPTWLTRTDRGKEGEATERDDG